MSKNKREGLLGSLLLVTGAAIGAASVLLYKENRPKRPGVVLEEAKNNSHSKALLKGRGLITMSSNTHISKVNHSSMSEGLAELKTAN